MMFGIPVRSVLTFLVFLLSSSAVATGIAVAVVEWRDETADLSAVERQIEELHSSDAKFGDQVDQIEASLDRLTLALSPTPAPTPTASLTANSVRVSQGTPGLRVDIDLTIENTSPSQDISYSSSQLHAIDDENTLYFPECWQSCSSLLRPGDKVRSQMYFPVPEGTQLAELIWEIAGVLETSVSLTPR